MELFPRKKVRKLQREALKYYPLGNKEAIRNWMSVRTAFRAADLTIKYDEDKDEFRFREFQAPSRLHDQQSRK